MSSTMDDEPTMRTLLGIKVFRRLWLALVVFSLGHLIQVVAASWLILEMTGSPLWVSAAIGAPTLPLLVLSLPAGAAADLFDRRINLLISSLVLAAAALTMSLLSALDELTPGRLVGLGLVIGVGIAFFNPTWHAMVPSLVPASLVPGAVSLNSASGGVATAAGPALGGLLVATAGPEVAFGVAAVGYLSVVIAVATAQTEDLGQETGSMVVAIAAGIRYLMFSRDYLWLLLLGSLFGFASASLRAMLPNLTSDVLDGGSAMYGVLLGLFGGGAMVGGITRSRISRAVGGRLLPMCIVAFGVAGLVVGFSKVVALTAVAMTCAGAIWTWILATLNSTYQVLTPDWVRGRTMGAFILSVFGFVPLGALASGALGAEIGAGKSLMVFSVAVVVIGILSFSMPVPVLEHIDPPVVVQVDAAAIPDVASVDSPALATTTWTVTPDRVDSFLEVLSDLRRIRMRTGASQWSAYRDATDHSRISEVFMLPSWEQRVRQMQRLDTAALNVIRRADELSAPGTVARRELIGVDVDRELKLRQQAAARLDEPSDRRPDELDR